MEPVQFVEQTNGYHHLTRTKAAKTYGPWEVDFTKLRVRMAGETATTVVTGEGLGPDLRVPVPFVLPDTPIHPRDLTRSMSPARRSPRSQSRERRSPCSQPSGATRSP